MTRFFCPSIGWLVFLCLALRSQAELLIVADEFPAMQTLAGQFTQMIQQESRIVAQTNLPTDLSSFQAVVVYIHRSLLESAENTLIQYTTNGGRLIVLHHSISSGKRQNRHWFDFLGIRLPQGQPAAGGYQWIEGVALDIVNVDPQHFITTNQCHYQEFIDYTLAPGSTNRVLPGFHLSATEVYLNHVFTGPKEVLLGLKYADAKTGKSHQQTTAGWHQKKGQGHLFYFMPGHSQKDFIHPVYARILANAVIWDAHAAPTRQ